MLPITYYTRETNFLCGNAKFFDERGFGRGIYNQFLVKSPQRKRQQSTLRVFQTRGH